MNTYYDVIVAKDYESSRDGRLEKKTAWNRVGRAWPSKSSDKLLLELYLIPNQIFVIKKRDQDSPESPAQTETAPF